LTNALGVERVKRTGTRLDINLNEKENSILVRRPSQMASKGLAFLRLIALAFIFLSLGLRQGFISMAASRPYQRRRQSRALQSHLKWVATLIGLHIEIHSDLPDDEKFLLLSNHVSYIDIVALGSLMPLAFLAKVEMSHWPILGRLAKGSSTLFVDRSSASSKLRALHELRSAVIHGSYCVFPEGTTTALGSPDGSTWFRGSLAVSARPGVPVYTCSLRYVDQERAAWIGDETLWPHLWSLLKRKETYLSLSFQKLAIESPSRMARQSLEAIQRSCQLLSRVPKSPLDQ
jgi:1-acyl-sn-glycerol-3-phosphate acyltransferase